MHLRRAIIGITSAALLAGCSTMERTSIAPADAKQDQELVGLDAAIYLLNQDIAHTLEAQVEERCGNGPSPVTEWQALAKEERNKTSVNDQKAALEEMLECRTDAFPEVLKLRRDQVKKILRIAPTIRDGADHQETPLTLSDNPNLSAEVNTYLAITRNLKKSILALELEQ